MSNVFNCSTNSWSSWSSCVPPWSSRWHEMHIKCDTRRRGATTTTQSNYYNWLVIWCISIRPNWLGHPYAVYAFGVKQSSWFSICNFKSLSCLNVRGNLREAKWSTGGYSVHALFAATLAFGRLFVDSKWCSKKWIGAFFFNHKNGTSSQRRRQFHATLGFFSCH